MTTQRLSFTPHLLDERSGQQGPVHRSSCGFGIPFHCEGFSLKGSSRAINEDQYGSIRLIFSFSVSNREALFLTVADGLGGEAAGEHASRIAIDSMSQFLKLSSDRGSTEEPEGLLKSAMIQAHLNIVAEGKCRPGYTGMGTTLTAALVLWPRAYVVHAGDSRGYRLRNGRLTRLTIDHTVEQQLRMKGLVFPGASHSSRYRHILWNHLGGLDRFPVAEVTSTPLESGDALLLVTDGVTDLLTDQDLADVASRCGSAESVSRKLVLAARDSGTRE